MKQISNSGKYEVTLTCYIDENHITASGTTLLMNTPMLVKIFRKKDNVSVTQLQLKYVSNQAIDYTNQACATAFGIKTRAFTFKVMIDILGATYSEVNGYYMSWAYCCRNGGITNFLNPSLSGLVGYLEFPALYQAGKFINYSTPTFKIPNGEFICKNQAFSMSFKCNEADGDVLKYKLVTPLKGSNDDLNYDRIVGPAPYAEITWKPGFSANSIIPASIPMKIDENTGEISVTANAEGLYAFAIQIEKYRGGKKIGVSRIDYQLPVKYCSITAVTKPTIKVDGNTTLATTKCPNVAITLETEFDNQWTYQWQLNKLNITGATTNKLITKDFGNFTVIRSLLNQCGSEAASDTVSVKMSTDSYQPKIKATKNTICESDTATLSVVNNPAYTYTWTENKTPIGNTNKIVINKVGKYAVTANNTGGCNIIQDSIEIANAPKPVFTLIPPSKQVLCPMDSFKIEVKETNFQYKWYRNNLIQLADTKNFLWVKKDGEYKVEVQNLGNTCNTTSSVLKFTQFNPITITIDSILPICNPPKNQLITLNATPTGGVFTLSGIGPVNKNLDISTFVFGDYLLKYIYKSPDNCLFEEKTTIRIIEPLKITSAKSFTVDVGLPTQIEISTNKSNVSYEWSPNKYLSSYFVNDPIITITDNFNYLVKIKSTDGCILNDTIRINPRKRIYIPNSFSPNGDGINDVWNIFGIDNINSIEISIFNKWGNEVFEAKSYNQPFDGFVKGEKLPQGIYIYQLKLIDDGKVTLLNGSLTILY